MADFRVTAYWYAARHGLPCDTDSLLALGLAAARHARWLGIGECKTWEGPPGAQFPVHTWPGHVFAYVACHAARVQAGVTEIYHSLPDAGWGEGAAPWDGDDIRPG
jgi:hypothetical protein